MLNAETSVVLDMRGVMDWPRACATWLTDRRRPGRSVLCMGWLGLVLASIAIALFSVGCARGGLTPASELFCKLAKGNPPWAFVAGLATLPGIALGWYWRTDSKNHELDGNEERARAEGFARYAQMLGNSDASTLGGIHGLKHLGLDDARRRNLVSDTLCSYVKSRVQRDYEAEAHTYPEEHEFPQPPHLTVVTAIQALSALHAPGMDLRDVDLENLEIHDLVLERADLRDSTLFQAKLPGAKMSRCKLDRANCYNIDLTEADLGGASFRETRLIKAILFGANLARSDLQGADFTNADLRGANLEGANLHRANLLGATIAGAILSQQQLASTEGTPQDAAVFAPAELPGAASD